MSSGPLVQFVQGGFLLMAEKGTETTYGAEQIQVLEGLEAVRRRPVCTSAVRIAGIAPVGQRAGG